MDSPAAQTLMLRALYLALVTTQKRPNYRKKEETVSREPVWNTTFLLLLLSKTSHEFTAVGQEMK